jgi:hypothetical protein
VIIDDNSNQKYVHADYNYKNIQVVNSEYPGRGELLPYYYFHKYKYFDNAVILHDSVFFHKRIHFELFKKERIIPLWHFDYNENMENSLRLAKYLKNADEIQTRLSNDIIETLSFKSYAWYGCFGVQSYINHAFLSSIEKKYNLFKLLNHVLNRTDRCSLERVMGAIFYIEMPTLYKCPSLLGNIWDYQKWGYSFDTYLSNYKHIGKPLVKVWTGR